jgi:hypothetical protein
VPTHKPLVPTEGSQRLFGPLVSDLILPRARSTRNTSANAAASRFRSCIVRLISTSFSERWLGGSSHFAIQRAQISQSTSQHVAVAGLSGESSAPARNDRGLVALSELRKDRTKMI